MHFVKSWTPPTAIALQIPAFFLSVYLNFRADQWIGYIHVQSIDPRLAYNFPTPFGDRGGSQSCNFGKSVGIEIRCGRFDLGICSRFLWFRGDFLQKSTSECTLLSTISMVSPHRTITKTRNNFWRYAASPYIHQKFRSPYCVCVPAGFLCVQAEFIKVCNGIGFLCFLAANLQKSCLLWVHIRRQDFCRLWLAGENFPIKNFARKILVRQSQFRIWRELAGSNTNYPLGYLQVRQSQRYPKGYFHPLNIKYPTGYRSLRYPKGYFYPVSDTNCPLG